ncbi:CARDB domain-containing protein [Methanobrevibacter filiformis]|uniref:Big-1 domain-containing protein n=1 Tax=Methanobrevibacter filiformis TaxID=55758 RepID=A0A162FMC9_9EURY|nr:Ig-like domain repeat protein [Methanobrevibacter filiformis]KZX12180.1 hypothetical protein MBFIL_12060 [Methanobrevibacter filiformis]
MKYKSSILIFALFITMVLCASTSYAAESKVVAANATNDEIQSIIDGAVDGDTIAFEGNEYNVKLVVTNKALSFTGNSNKTKLNAVNYKPVFEFVETNGSSFSNFTFNSESNLSGTYLIYGNNVKNLKITNNIFNGTNVQLNLYNPVNCTITDNLFENSTGNSLELVRDKSAAYGLYGNNTITNNIFRNHKDVIRLRTENTTVANNIIDNFTGIPDIDMASMAEGSIAIYFDLEYADGVIYNNTITNGDIGIKHKDKYSQGTVKPSKIYGNVFSNLTIMCIEYANADHLYHNNKFVSMNVSFKVSKSTSANTVKDLMVNNSYSDVNYDIVDSNSIPYNLKPAVIKLESKISNNTVFKGSTVIYNLKISNIGDFKAEEILAIIKIPEGFKTNSSSVSQDIFSNNMWYVGSLDPNGYANLQLVLEAIAIGKQTLSVNTSYDDGKNDSEYQNANISNVSVNVELLGTTITLSAPTKLLGATSVITATLKDNNGKLLINQTVTVTINGRIYSIITNSKGIAIVHVKNLKKGSYTVNAAFTGTADLKSSNAKKITHKVTAPDLKIVNVKKYKNTYKITIQNIGDAKSKSTELKLAYKNKSKTVSVKSIKVGKSLTVSINFFKYLTHKKYKKTATINPKESFKESNYKNNIKKLIK